MPLREPQRFTAALSETRLTAQLSEAIGIPGPPGPEGPPGDPATQTPWSQDIDAAGFRLLNAGDIGIHVADPAYALDVDGDVNCSGRFRVGGGDIVGPMPADVPDGPWSSLTFGRSAFVGVSHSRALFVTFGPVSEGYYLGGTIDGAFALTSQHDLLPKWFVTREGSVHVGGSPPFSNLYKMNVAGDCDITGVYRVNGVPLDLAGVPGPEGPQGDPGPPGPPGPQTPWASHIDAAGFELRNPSKIVIGASSAQAALDVRGASTSPDLDIGSAAICGGSAAHQVRVGFNSASNYGWIQAVESAVATRPLCLNRAGGNVSIGPLGAPVSDCLTMVPIIYSTSQDGGIRLQTPGGEITARVALKISASGLGRLAFDGPSGIGVAAEALAINWDTGGISMPRLPSSNPGAGSKQIYYDPADGNRLKFAA